MQRRQRPGAERSGLPVQNLQRTSQTEPGRRRDGQRVPEIENMIALVIMRDAGVGIDDVGDFVFPVRVALAGDERRFVTERLGIEDGADLTDGAPGFERADALHDFGFTAAEFCCKRRPRTHDDRDFGLNQV